MSYSLLKIIHVISACLLFGTGLSTAIYMYLAHRSQNREIIANTFKMIVKGDWYFTLPSGFIQLATGLLMVIHCRLPFFTSFWLWGSTIGYLIAALCWFPVVYLQIQLKNIACQAVRANIGLPTQYYLKFKYWFCLGLPAFGSLLVVFYLMVNRTTHFSFL